MNQCNQCQYYSGDKEKGMCYATPPKINLAIVDADWNEDSLINACIRPMVMAEDKGCGFFKRTYNDDSFIV